MSFDAAKPLLAPLKLTPSDPPSPYPPHTAAASAGVVGTTSFAAASAVAAAAAAAARGDSMRSSGSGGRGPPLPAEEPASPLARLWQQKNRDDDQDFTIHVFLGVAPPPPAADGSPREFDTDTFKAVMEHSVGHLPRFASLLVKRRTWWGGEAMAWIPTELDIHQHVRNVDIRGLYGGQGEGPPPPGEVHHDCVMRYMEEQAAVPLRRDIPLWEVQILTHPPLPVDSASSTSLSPSAPSTYSQTVLWRIHHSVADGIALAALLLRVTQTGDGRTPQLMNTIPERYTRKRSPLQWGQFYLSYAINSLGAVVKLLLLLVLWGDPAGGVKAPSTDIRHEQRELVRLSLPLEPAKDLARESGSTVNDLLLCLMAAATSWYRLGFPFGPASNEEGSKEGADGTASAAAAAAVAPPRSAPRALFMANIRSPAEFQRRQRAGVVRSLTEQVPLGTRIGFFCADLPSAGLPPALQQRLEQLRSRAGLEKPKNPGGDGISPSFPGRVQQGRILGVGGHGRKEGGPRLLGVLQRIQQQTVHIKHSFEAWFVNRFLVLVCLLFGPMAMWRVVLHVLGKTTLALSNVPGPPEPLFLVGSEILRVDQFLGGGPLGATVHSVSYGGTMFVTVTANPDTVSAQRFGQLLLLAWEQLLLERTEAKLARD